MRDEICISKEQETGEFPSTLYTSQERSAIYSKEQKVRKNTEEKTPRKHKQPFIV